MSVELESNKVDNVVEDFPGKLKNSKMNLKMKKDTFNEKLNLSIGIFDIIVLGVFDEDDDGKVYPTYKSVKKMLDLFTDYGNFNEELVVTTEGQFGRFGENGYQDGILGLLQRREADVSLLPMSINIPQPPGQFTAIVTEEAYYINGFARTSSIIDQDVTSSFTLFLPATWILLLSLIYLFEVISTYHYQHSVSILTRFLSSADRLPSILFVQQSVVHRSIIKTSQLLLLNSVLIIFMASFKTTTIGGFGESRVNTLRDIVDLDKTPWFVEGLSMFELFEAEITKDYADVYQLAKRKGSARPTRIGERVGQIQAYSSENVWLYSEKVGKIGNSIEGTDHPMAKYSYWSDKAFYQSLSAFLVNPRHDVDQIIKRTSKLLQSALVDWIMTAIIREISVSLPFRRVTEHVLNKRKIKPKKDIKFVPLKIGGMRKVFIGLFIVLSVALVISILEIFFSLVHK
ncbi:uncharacterized protein LOC107361188 isoform X2 [Tetranychus urticae]|uniref:uncharacterized protein LOC107361188 isoform X2 n=1 Tax=Tetranychus urticae TaxID=32264 RepID=UPI000D64A536|nr:uncharacterized protein LOC107361188 isoform X2 [Tetranychus urticae]